MHLETLAQASCTLRYGGGGGFSFGASTNGHFMNISAKNGKVHGIVFGKLFSGV